MKNELEILTYEKIRHMKIFLNQITYRNFHTHSAFEFLWALEGRGEIRFRDGAESLRPGSMIVVNPHEAHEIDAQGGHVLCMIYQVSRHFCQEYFPLLKSVRFSAHEMAGEAELDRELKALASAGFAGAEIGLHAMGTTWGTDEYFQGLIWAMRSAKKYGLKPCEKVRRKQACGAWKALKKLTLHGKTLWKTMWGQSRFI